MAERRLPVSKQDLVAAKAAVVVALAVAAPRLVENPHDPGSVAQAEEPLLGDSATRTATTRTAVAAVLGAARADQRRGLVTARTVATTVSKTKASRGATATATATATETETGIGTEATRTGTVMAGSPPRPPRDHRLPGTSRRRAHLAMEGIPDTLAMARRPAWGFLACPRPRLVSRLLLQVFLARVSVRLRDCLRRRLTSTSAP